MRKYERRKFKIEYAEDSDDSVVGLINDDSDQAIIKYSEPVKPVATRRIVFIVVCIIFILVAFMKWLPSSSELKDCVSAVSQQNIPENEQEASSGDASEGDAPRSKGGSKKKGWRDKQMPPPKYHEWYSKCEYIFMDAGTNRGDNLQTFANVIDNEEITEFKNKIFKTHKVTESDFCVFGFEGNKNFKKPLEDLEKELSKHFKHLQIFTRSIVLDKGGHKKLYMSYDTLGSSISAQKETGGVSNMDYQWVRAIDLADFISNFHPKVLFLKIDVEGAEYPVLSHILTDGRFCKMSATKYIAVEYHAGINAAPEPYRNFDKMFPLVIEPIMETQCNVTFSEIPSGWGKKDAQKNVTKKGIT